MKLCTNGLSVKMTYFKIWITTLIICNLAFCLCVETLILSIKFHEWMFLGVLDVSVGLHLLLWSVRDTMVSPLDSNWINYVNKVLLLIPRYLLSSQTLTRQHILCCPNDKANETVTQINNVPGSQRTMSLPVKLRPYRQSRWQHGFLIDQIKSDMCAVWLTSVLFI